MKRLVQGICVLIFVLGMASISEAGSGAFRVFASDSEATAKGGAFVGEADNPSAVFYNPAGLTQLEDGYHLSLGLAALQPIVSHTSTSGVETQMRRETFKIPHVYFVSDFGIENVAIGIGGTSNWGLGTDWANDSFSAYAATKTELINLDNMVTFSYALNDQLSVSVGGVYVISTANKEKAIYQSPGANAGGQLKGRDQSLGYTLSTWYKLSEAHQFGLLYKSPISLEYDVTVSAHGFSDLGALPYRTIFGGEFYTTIARTDLQLPQSVVLGYSFKPENKWRFNFDVEWMDWSSVESERVYFLAETDPTRLALLDALTASDRDWKSTISYMAGTEYEWNDKFRLRGGYFYNPAVIPEANFDTAVPVTVSHGINFGFGYDIRENLTVDAAWTTIVYVDKNVNNTVGNALGANLDGKYENITNLALVTLNYSF